MTKMETDAATRRIEAALQRTMEHLTVVEGLHPDLILAVAHGHALTLIATRHGGTVAADCARNAAERVEGLPSFTEEPLAGLPAQGRA